MNIVKLRAVGGSLVMTLPVEIAEHLQWSEGQKVMMRTFRGSLIVERAMSEAGRVDADEEEILRGAGYE